MQRAKDSLEKRKNRASGKLDQIRSLSLKYAQRTCLTPTEYQDKLKAEKEARRIARINRDPEKARRKYSEYLSKLHWKELRAKTIAERGFRCEECGCGNRLQVHHKTYKRKGQERPEDLVVLCRGCHRQKHGLQRNNLTVH